MPVAIETLHPDVYVVETDGQPRVIGVSVNTAGFVGVSEKGPIDRAVLVTNTDQFETRYGEFFRGSYLEPAVRYFFLQGGSRVFIARVVGTGAAASWTIAKNSSDSGGPGKVTSDPGPFNLDVGETLVVEVAGYATQTFTFTGTQSLVAGNGFTGNDVNGLTLIIQFSGEDQTTITFSGLPLAPTVNDVANFLNPLLEGGACVVNGSEIDFQADQIGSGSAVIISGGTALADLGHTISTTYGTGNVPNIDAVTGGDAATALASLQGAYALGTQSGELQIITAEKGTAATVQIDASSTAVAFGFDNVVHAGWGYSGSAAQVISGNVEPFDLQPNETLDVDIVGNPTQTFTFLGTQATRPAAGPYVPAAVNGLTLQIQFSGYDATTITFSGLSPLATLDEVLDAINANIRGGSAYDPGTGAIDFKADQYGSGSTVTIIGGNVLPSLLHVAGVTNGTGNVADVDAVTAQEVVDLINATIAGGTASLSPNNGVIITTTATGDSATIQVLNTSTATGIGFNSAVQYGMDADFQDSIQFSAENPGAWGNSVAIRTITWEHETREDIFNADTEFEISSLRGVTLGDVIYTYDPDFVSRRYVGIVHSIDTANTKIGVLPLVDDLTGLIPSGSPIQSCSQHRLSTISTVNLVDGDDRITVASAANLPIGARIVITDGVTMTDAQVAAVEADVIRFTAPVSLSATIVSGAIVVSQEWKLDVLEKGVIVETHEYLSMEEDDIQDYFGTRLNGDTNESLVIEATDLYAAPVDYWRALPLAVTNQEMAYGQNGSTPTDNDYIGNESNPRSGMYLFDDVTDLNFFALPGITTVTVQSEAIAYAEWWGNRMVILDTPRHADEPTEAYNYRMYDLNADSSYAALYYPWLIVRDPVVGNSRLAIPPSGHIAGQYAATGATRGVHVAPANVVVRGVVDLTYRCGDAEQDILNPVGVNAIRFFPGEGIRIWGARTLFSFKDGRHYVPVRRTLNYVKESVKRGNRWAVFQPNDIKLWSQIEAVNREFLHSMWLRGMLYPTNDVSRSFFVKCDSETNPISEIKEGRVNCEIGINPLLPAEFCIFRIGVWDGGSSVEEEIARRG